MKYALITGASSGIGEAFVYKLDSLGYTCIMIARREERLKQIKAKLLNDAIIIQADLSDKEQCLNLLKQIKDYKIDLFINNAGLGYCGLFDSYDLSHDINMIDVNISAFSILLKYMIGHMSLYNGGTIINVASIAGLMSAGPYMSTYYASKSYVVSLTKALQCELKQQKSSIYLACLCPGPVLSEFDTVANVQFSLKGITAKKCVEETIKGIKKRQSVIIPTRTLKVAMALSFIVPDKIMIKIVSKNQKKKIYR